MKKIYTFGAHAVANIIGYVEAESEEEAIKLIKQGDFDEITNMDMDEPISDVLIVEDEDE